MEIFVVGMIIGAIVGALIGNSKGRPLVGALLGFFLGLIGWIITACLPTTLDKEAEKMARLRMAMGAARDFGDTTSPATERREPTFRR